MIEKGRRSDITNLSLQDEEKLSYATYFEALETVSKTPQVVRTSSACSNIKTDEEDPLNAKAKLQIPSYWFTSSNKGISYFPKNTERMKKSVQLINSIGHDRSRQNKSMRNEEHLSISIFWSSISTKMTSSFGILQH